MSDSLDQTPQMALRDALSCADAEQPDKCLILFLWDADGKYDTKFFNSGLSASQAVSLLAVNQSKFIELMKTL